MKAGRILLFACLFLWTGVSTWAIANPENRCSRVAAGAISNARYYDPELGRFIQPDDVIQDLSNPQSYNRYSYCVNDPLRYTDPTGKDFVLNAGLVPGPVPYMTARSTLGQIGASVYNMLPLVDNSIHQGLRGVAAVDRAAGDVLHATTFAVTGDPQLAENSRNLTLLVGGVGELGKVAKVEEAAGGATEVVQRAMSQAELQATKDTGLLRGGRVGTAENPHFVSDAVNSDAKRAQQRLALGQAPDVKATLEVPSGTFSAPSKVQPKNGMPGGGTERTATGVVPVKIIKTAPMQ